MIPNKHFALKALAAIAVTIALGFAAEYAYSTVRLNSGPHAWFAVSSYRSIVGGGRRGGREVQVDSIEGGPFESLSDCTSSQSADAGYLSGRDYCRELLITDAKSMRRIY
jgi:hypothetical protein